VNAWQAYWPERSWPWLALALLPLDAVLREDLREEPRVRAGHQLYDTTVNDVKSPGIFVTYHDAQAYPEYLVKFKQ